MTNIYSLRKKYLRIEKTTFCAGCGYGIFTNCFLKAAEELEKEGKFDFHKTIFISGIGCAAWIPNPYFLAETLHTTHGRALAFATGVKLAKPASKIVVISGDGDLATIGGNHLIHTLRRNLPMSIFCLNNYVYGMTGGQPGATTPQKTITPVTPEGSIEKPFDIIKLALGAEAKFVSRYPIVFPKNLIKGIKKNLLIGNEKSAFTEVISICPTHFGRKNNLTSPAKMLEAQKEQYISKKKALETQNPEQKKVFGDFESLDEYFNLTK